MTTPRDVWRWAVWFGVLSGLGQALIVAIAYFTTHRIVFTSPDVVWMAPAANAAVFAVVAARILRSSRSSPNSARESTSPIFNQ